MKPPITEEPILYYIKLKWNNKLGDKGFSYKLIEKEKLNEILKIISK